MGYDRIDSMYDALVSDGAQIGTRQQFKKLMLAPGKEGYRNRLGFYQAMKQDGANIGATYEDFGRALGLHAVKPQQQKKPVQPVKKLTMKQRAQEVAAQYRKPRQQKAQQPRTATTSGTDYMQNWRLMHMRNDQMTPTQQVQASNMRARTQRAREQAERQEQQRATPISRSRITPTAKNFNETMQQLSTPEARRARAKQQREDDARAFAQYEVEGNKFIRNDGHAKGILGNDLLELVDSSMNEAQELTRQQYQQNLDEKGGIYAPQSVKEQAFRDAQTQEQVNRQNVLMNNLSSKINEIYSQKGMQRHIAESAEKLNMSVEEYVDKYVTPEIMNYAQKALTMRNQEEIMPHGALDYIAKNLSNSIIGMVVAPSVMSRDTRQRLQEGIAIADGDAEIQKVAGHKDETYRSGIGTRFASTAVNMAADSGPLAVIGAGASAAVNTGTRVLTNGLVKAGVMKAAQKLTAQQMAFKVANMTTAQKIMSGLGTRTATGALNLAGYSGVTAALNQASTGDDTSLQAIGEAGLKGAEHGAVTGAMFGVSGAIMSPWVSKFGITGMEKSTGERLLHGAQKFGATAAGLGVEAGTMMVADNVTGDKDISFGTWLEDVVMVGAFKAGEPSNFVKMGNILHHLTHNSGGNFVIGKNANGSPIAVDIRLTPDEKNELISSASGKNLMDAFVKVDRASKTAPRDPKYKTAYTDFMNDPDVSQSTKEKVNATMGLFNTTRGKSYRSVNDVKNKQILEYTKNGTLLTRTSYKNADERRAILYKQKLYRDNDDMMSLMGYARMKDMQLTDEDGNVTKLALGFLRDNGYDMSKDASDPNNARLINELRNQKSALYLDWMKYADKNGLLGNLRSETSQVVGGFMNALKEIINDKGQMIVDIDKIMRKDPMKRTDEENRIFYHVKRALEDELFPSWRPHADQSASQGKTVAEEHSLGTDNPDSGVVVDELRNLRNAEQALDAAMDSNDVFKQTFEKLHQQGLTPAQIYDALIQNGLTEEELTPLAQYINANARVQGMQQATADAIEENVKSFISDWSYHGTLNGQPMNGEQALYVQDSSGRTLLVGSGDVAFDQTTGKAKEGSGDMLVCLDPNTKELVYVKADDVTLFQNQPLDQFAAEYRQRLQMKNSEPYNQAAQEQAMLDAAKPQQEQEAPQDNTTKSEDNTTKEGDLTKVDTTLTKVDTTSGEDNTTNENLAPQEQPQPSRKFADGSDVPMATDSKGRPTPDYASMTPEQSAEILTEDFGENAEKVVDGQIQKAEKALKDAEKMKMDYTAEPNDIMEQEALKNQTIEAAKKQLDHAQNIKKTMTAKKVAETVGKTEQTEGAHEAGSVAAQKFVNAPRLVGNKRTRMLPDGETKIKGHYEIVPAESLTPSHDVNNDYKKSEGFPTDAEGRTVNDRDYEHDKAAQQNTDQIARKYNGMAIEQVPVVSDEGIVYDGNGRTMAGQKAAKEGTDAEYINDLLENAENFGFTREQIEQSGIEHPRLVMVTDERLPYDAATFAKFNRNEKKTQSNTEQAVAKAKTLTADEVGAIVAEIEGNGSLDAFFNNSKAINDLVKTLVEKGIIGQNEVAQMMDSPERLSAQGREYVKNLLLGSIFKPETIRMLGIDSTVKNKAINAIRSVMDNMKLGEFSLRDEIDQAIQLLYEARQGGNKVDTLLRTPSMFGEDAAKRYPSISQMMALALEGKVSDFRDLLDEYNRIAKARNTGEGNMFEAAPTKEELINEYLNFKKWQDYGTGHSEIEGGNDVSGNEEPQQEASGGNEPAEAGTEPERPRVEEADDLVNKELESRIKVTDEEAETPSKNGPIMKQKILIDGDKEVIKVDEPNDKGEYTGSYYEYDGKKFGDLNEVVEYVDEANADKLTDVESDWQNKIDDYIAEHYPHHNGVRSRTPEEQAAYDAEAEAMKNDPVLAQMRKDAENAYKEAEGPLPLLPKEENPDPTFDPIAAAAAEFKKEHPLTEDEIMKADVDDLSKDMALDYLNGEVTDDLHRAIYESIFAKTRGQKTEPKVEAPKTEPSADPMEGIKNAAEGFEKEKKTKAETEKKPQQKADDAAVAASNKKVNDLWDMLKNAGKDEVSASFIGLNSKQLEVLPKLVSAMAENAYLRIKRGMHNLEDVVKEMRKEFAPAAKLFKKEDVDAIYEQMMNIRYRDGEQRMSLKEWADYYEKTSPKHQENLVGDSKTAEERKLAEKKFIDVVNLQLGFKHKFNGIVELRKMAERIGLKDIKDTDLQELAETAIVKRARGIASSESTNDAVKFERIKTLYENQPSLNQRDSERVMKQQYSTPAPYAFLADMYVKGNGKVIESALEPSAGNGMLTIGLPMDKVHVNDIDAQRLANLRRQGFKNVTSQDGTQPFADKDVDAVVTNPPFGSATPKEYDGYKISSLEGQMAINALESMKDDGRAAIIIGGKTEYAKNGSLNPKDKAFLGYLYSHYNVEDVINVDGSLYAKQGTNYPTRIILINGRRLNENAFPPVKDKARAEAVKDYDELYKRIEDDILRGERMDSSIGGETRSAQPELDKQGSAGTPKERVRTRERGGSKPDGERESDLFDSTSVSGTHDDLENQRGTEPRQDGRLSDGDTGTDRTGADVARSEGAGNNSNSEGRVLGSGGNGQPNTQLHDNESSESGSGRGPRRQLQRLDQPVRGLSTEKVTYSPNSENPFTLQSVMPADQQEAVNKNLKKLGDADQFLVDELGYNDKDDLYSHLAAEQVDSVALALQQAKKGNAFIIGDQTGIGKGRQAASFVRYAIKNGQIPVYFTQKAHLLSDVYRDLVDIGSPELRPFILGSKKEATVTDSDGNVVYPKPSDKERDRVLDYIEKNGKLPDEYDYVLTTYSQVGTGVYEFDENGARKEKKLAKGKSFGAAALSGQKRRDAIEKLMDNAYLILDESHTAGGNSGQGNYFQHIIQKAKNVTFFSATFAKRPDNMPIYALRTAMNEGGMKASDLIDAVKRGGATLQEIMSQTLTQCGQMIRRERDMTGVTIDWKAIDDPERVQEQREQYDSIIGLFNDIINFQKKYVSGYVDKRNDELAEIQSTIGIKKGTAALGIKNQPFASKAFNTVQQVLLSLKAKSAAERAIDYLKQGMKPVIALNNTNESQTGNLALGEEMDAPDLGTSLKKGLEGTLRYTQKDAKDNSESGYFNLEDLGEEAVEAYHELEKKIEQTSTGLSLSPIDVIKNELQKAGYKVGELTGRQTEFVYNENGTVTKVKRADTDKKKLAREFNDGQIDALILNKSAATGISLHASSKYKDQRKRVMIVAQQQLDVNDEVQMRGRIDRTGQVARGAYEYVVSLIPAEQRLLMMFKAKLKSLDANTTSSQKSKFNEMEVADITNKYGDKVVREYMAEHLDLYARMADPFGWEKSNGDDLSRIDPQTLVASGGGVGDGEAGADASKLLGRMALLRVSEQEKMLQEIGELYANEIQRLNEMGENDLEITELPLKAKTLHREVWKQGAEPGGDNAFADNTYIEKVNMAILKKPMKASEVKASQDGLTGGKTWDEYKTDKKASVKEYFDQKIADETQKYEERAVKAATKAKEKYIKDGKKGQKDSGMSDEQIEKMAGYQYDNIYKQEKDKLNDVMKNLKAKAEMFERVLDTFDTNSAFVLPADMNNPNELSGFGNSYGRLIDIKITDNYSPNASSVSFATLDGRRKITFPIAGKVGSGENKVDIIGSIDRMTKQAAGMGDSHLRVLNQNFDNWDRLTSNESRKNGYIVTGNLMQALVDSKDQGLGGQLVKYTTDTGEVKTGILMPDRFDPKGLTTDAPINSVTEKFELSSWHGGIDEVTSSDGEVKVKRIDNYRGNYYELRVPKSKAKGGKYFMDNDLLKLVNDNNFETRGNSMLAEFKPEQLKPVLDRLSKMGVKVQEERNTSEDEGTHFREDRGLQYSKTDTKDVKNSRIIPEDVDKNVSSQIEKRFDDEVERLYGDSSEKPDIEKEANKYATKQYIDTFKYDKKGNPIQKYEGLKSVIDSLDSKLKDIEQKYGFNRKSDINEIKSAIGTETAEGNDSRGMGGVPQGDSVRISGRKGVLSDYKETALSLAAAQRAKEYLLERFNNIRLKYGLEEGDWASKEQVERIFNDYNSDADVKKIFDRIEGLVDVLGTKLKGEAYKKVNTEGYYYHPKNYILIDTDFLSSIQFGKQELASTICHEMLHVVTSDIINLYRKGHGDLLNERQRKAAKEVVDLYDKINSYFERHFEGAKPYALTNPAEIITELANPTWRRIAAQMPVAKGWFRSFIAAVRNMLGFPPKVSALDRLDKALENVIRNLDYGVFQKGAELNDEIVNKKASIPVSSHITQLSEKTGAKVNMVSSVDEINNKAAKAAIEDGRKITGWYDEKTGEVHLYMPNIHDRYTAEKTIWHEVVGHKGMRELFGDERFDKFLREVWYDLDKPENAALKKLVDEERKFNPLYIYDAIEEGIARLAEDGKGEPGFWNGIKNKVSDFLHEIGYRVAPNTKDVKYLLWLSKNLQKNPNDPYWKLRAEAVKYRLDHERMPAVVAHDGMFYGNDGKVRSMDNLTKAEWNEATDGEIHFRTTPSAGTALDRYHRSLDEHGYMFTESYMDNMLSLKKLMNAIVPDKKIEDIASSENPYILQNTMQGAMSDAAQMFERNVMKPLDKAMADVLDAFDGKKDDEKIRNFNLYMITKHGLERNRIFYVRDALKYMRMNEKTKKLADTVEFDWNNEKATLDEKLERGDIDLKTYYERMDDFIRTYVDSDNKFDAGEHDYSGIHAIQEVAKSSDPYDDAEAIQSVMDSEAKMESIKKGAVKDYWDKVKAATQYSIDTDYKNGLISRELYGHVSDMFNWYVPLRKYDEATAEDTYGYITEQGDPKSYIGSTIMRARGHKYLSETNVLAQIGAMGNRAIKNGGMNAIRQAFARFVRNNSNNNLVTETRVWYADDPITHTTVERYPDIPEDATADEINQIVADFNMEMKDLESKGLATKVYRRGRIGYKFQRAENKSQHIVEVKIAGRTHAFVINGNPRAAQALNGLLEHKNDTLAGRVTASISRKMAQLCTSFNPEFVMRNMIKDFEFASTNLLAKEGLVYTKRFEQYYAKVGIIEGIRNSKLKDFADTGGFGLYAKYRNGTLDTTNKLHRYFKEFMENGGETGWVQIKNMKDFTKEYKLHIKGERSKVQKVGKGFYNAIFKNLENVNEIAENLARFATYCASRDSNRSIIRSVYDAKEVSTNFNRHGSGNAVYSFKNGEMGTGKTARKNIYGFTAAWFRNSSMFFNAGIQSTNLLIKNFKNNKAGTIGYIASAPFISGMAMALLNNFIISNEDEKDRKGVKDPYAELPEYIRRNNLCVYIGGGEFVTIPLAIEERAFYGLGDFAAGMTFSKNISSQKMPNLTENKKIDKYLNPFMDAVGCMSQLVPVADYLGNASFGKHPVQETIKAVAPSATSPFLEWMYNSDWKGAPIQRDNKFDENQPSWMLAYKGTPEWMINMNKKVNALTNDVAPGNEDMKGNDFLDEVTNPSALHHFYGSYLGGAATFVERVAGLIKNGKDTETKDIPFVRSLLYTPNEQSSLQRTKSKWYNYKDEMEKTMANVDRLKSKNVPLEKRISNYSDYYRFQNSKDAAKVRVIELAEKQMKQWKKLRDKSSDTESINFANLNIDRIMMEAVDDLDKLN
nr:MAG TPA: notch-like protein [Caudoviricetes sp.]